MAHRSTHVNRRVLFFTLYLAYIAAGALSILPGPTLSLLTQHTHVMLDQAGWIFTSSAFGFVIGVVLAGTLSRRLSPKSILALGLLLMSTTSIITPWTSLFALLLLSQFFMGIGFGFLDVSINMLMSLAFADTLSEDLIGLHSSFGLGSLLAPLLLSLSLALLHHPIWAYLTGSLIGMLCFFLLLRQQAPIPATASSGEQTPTRQGKTPRVLGQLLLWLMALEFFFYVGAEVGFGDWIATAVSQSAAMSLALAAPVATAFWLGLTVGRLVSSQLIKRGLLSENRLLALSMIAGCLSGLLAAVFPGQPVVVYAASTGVGFFFGPLFPGLMAIASRRFAHALGMISGALLISSGIAGMVFPMMMGMLIPAIGLRWVLVVPALACLFILVPFGLVIRKQRYPLQMHSQEHTIETKPPASSITK